jgi:hypothetical protein
MKTAMASEVCAAKQGSGNWTNHPPRPKTHPWKSGAAYRVSRQKHILARTGRPPKERCP